MERPKKEKRHRKKAPRVPIKTYKWEDIRRERLRGGYPWTYLYKEPFHDEIDSNKITMEKKLKSKLSSTPQEQSFKLEIKEITNGAEEHQQDSLTPEPSGYIVITEVPSDSESHSKDIPGSSVTIEEEPLNLESAESSDNISQYLDKEEPPIEPAETTSKPKEHEETKADNGQQERAKSEEPKRKRKLSIDSSYSRKSLSKLAIMKKLKEAKDKIKVPKLNLPSLPNISILSNPLKQDSVKKSKKEPEKKKDKSKEETIPTRSNHSDPNAKPEYIHIPLKPPEGKTDEFSYLEFGEKKPEEPKVEEPPKPPPVPAVEQPTIEISEPYDDGRRFSGDSNDIVAFEILKTETIDLDHGLQPGNDFLIIEQEDDEKSESRSMIIIMSGPEDEETNGASSKQQSLSRQGSRKVRAKSAEPEKKRKLSVESGCSRNSLSKLGFLQKLKDAKDKLKISLSRSGSKKASRKKVKDDTDLPKPPIEPKAETKQEKSSGDVPKYIHIPLKPPPGQSDEFSYLEFEEKCEEKMKEKQKEENKEEPASKPENSTPEQQSSIESPESPKPDGVQFIFLTPPSDDEVLSHLEVPETPSIEKSFNLTELKQIAKKAVDKASPKSNKKLQSVAEEERPETPTPTELVEEKKEEPPEADKPKKTKTKKKKTKQEEDKDKKIEDSKDKDKKPEDDKNKDKKSETEQKIEKMVVDEEDGLKLTESAMAKQEQNIKAKEVVETTQELKSNLKSDGSPVLKKKVSFKRRSRDDSKDGDYEDIQVPADDKSTPKDKASDEHKSKLTVMGNSQSMSVDEEKSYLDEQKIIKSTSLEEDYNRWSKLSDHEYEPVNPPPDNVSPVATAAPTVHVIDTDPGLQPKTVSLASSTTSLERRMLGAEVVASPEESFTVHDMQAEIENKYFSKPAESPSKPQTTVHTVVTTTTTSSETPSQPSKKSEGPGKFQLAIKAQTDKFKTKLHEIKKPNIKLPSKPTIKKPNLQKFKFERPKINLPKIPDTAKITLPTFTLPRKSPLKRSLKERQLSTESNAGGSKRNYFDFKTYPRLFKKKPKDDLGSFSSKNEREVPEFATVPRTKRNKVEDDRWGGRESIRIPLHAQESIEDEEREDSVERRMASHMRYDQDIDIDDAYEKENQEIHTASPFSHGYNSRWNHGSFHPSSNQENNEDSRNRQVTDLDYPDEIRAPHESFDTNTSKDIHSSESSIHRRGVIEEIDSDEFFLRQKGISQDNIEVGMYLNSEIREALKSPSNALADLQRGHLGFSFDPRASNQSLPETPSKRKIVKKPKRKKTPHVSHEQISFDQDSELDTDLPPSRPKRRSRRNKKQKDLESIIPYQETIAVEVPNVTAGLLQHVDDSEQLMYENEQMEGKEQPEITLVDPYAEHTAKYDSEEEVFKEDITPAAPPRKHRSLKSLTYSEHDSILGDVDPDIEHPLEDVEVYKTEHEYIIPTPEIPPTKPPRTLSRSSSKSHTEEILEEIETPSRPSRTKSRSRTQSGGESLTLEEPCIEETCVQDFRDCMGYAVIDKNIKREPPLPPPRTPPRRKRSVQSGEQKFFTVPRSLNNEPPTRPIRNYSTLGPSRPPRRKQPINMTDEEKENIDITQYIEIEDEPNRDLHSGEVIQKMRDRPLPAPPRPPRKTRTLQDITSEENLLTRSQENIINEEKLEYLEEAEVSTQTEPVPDDYLEDIVQEDDTAQVDTEQEPLVVAEPEPVIIERRLITPTNYTYEEETITHGTLVVEPLNGAKILPDSEFTRIEKPVERIIPIGKEYEDETSEIPDEFLKLRDPEPVQTGPRPPSATEQVVQPTPAQTTPPQPSVIERIIERPVLIQPDSSTEVEVLKAHKLQVSDLDVDRLSVNELLASRIVVSEIEGGNIQANEISSKSGALKIGEIELPPGIVQQLFEKLQSVAQEQQSSGPIETRPATETSPKESSEEAGQKKTPFEPVIPETLPPQRPPRKTEDSPESSVPPIDALIEEPQNVDIECTQDDSLIISETEEIPNIPETVEPPKPPVRTDSSIKPPEPESDLTDPMEVEVEEPAPLRPPRHTEKIKVEESTVTEQVTEEPKIDIPEQVQVVPLEQTEDVPRLIEQQQMEEPEIDDEPPPRPPEPQIDYMPSQPPASFYALRAQQYVNDLEGDIPMAPRRRRHQKPRISRSSSDESPAPPPSRRRYRSPEPTIPQLTGQLIHACGLAANSSIKRLIAHITNNVLRNTDGQQDLHITIVILLVLIAGLILLGYGDGKTVHYHHWEFFNPPRDM